MEWLKAKLYLAQSRNPGFIAIGWMVDMLNYVYFSYNKSYIFSSIWRTSLVFLVYISFSRSSLAPSKSRM